MTGHFIASRSGNDTLSNHLTAYRFFDTLPAAAVVAAANEVSAEWRERKSHVCLASLAMETSLHVTARTVHGKDVSISISALRKQARTPRRQTRTWQ
jgi:hypothetical protein